MWSRGKLLTGILLVCVEYQACFYCDLSYAKLYETVNAM